MKIAFGADPFGLTLKEAVKAYLSDLGHATLDLGGTVDGDRNDYDAAHEVAGAVASGECERGVLVCGTGTRPGEVRLPRTPAPRAGRPCQRARPGSGSRNARPRRHAASNR